MNNDYAQQEYVQALEYALEGLINAVEYVNKNNGLTSEDGYAKTILNAKAALQLKDKK